jgi:ethanolamine utilization protein EutP (predicted NTPase)
MSLQLTPLEYAVSMPAIDHNCLLFSQSARRGDSSAIETLCWRSDTPLYLVCDKCALSKDTVAKHLLESAGAGNVFVTSTCNEKAFLNISGTGAAYAVAYDIAASLGHTLPDTMPAMQWENLESYADKILLPEEENYLVLYGPAGRSAAEAFTGYHIESLGPTLAYDMKNFTHGVWRGLKEKGRHSVYFLEDSDVVALAAFLKEKLANDHQYISISAPQCHWSVEPFALFILMIHIWAKLCLNHAADKGNWSPLQIDMSDYSNYAGIVSKFDIATMRAIKKDIA